MVYNCHCTNCRRIGGGAFSTPVTVMEAGFAFTAGEPHTFEWTSDAGNRRFGWFCGACGSRIAHGQIPSPGVLSVRSGTLDDTLVDRAGRRHLDPQRVAVGAVGRPAAERAAADGLRAVRRALPAPGAIRGLVRR